MDDNDSIDMSDNDEFILDVDLTAANVQDVINFALAEEGNHSPLSPSATTTTTTSTAAANASILIDLPPPSEEVMKFDGNQFGFELLKHADQNDLSDVLYEHWRHFVPQCFLFHTNLIKGMVEQRADEILFRPLNVFLYGTSDVERAIENVRSFNKRPTVCGHLFKSEEPTYFCRDCCVDPTCVLCTECFLQSEHRKHRYKMNVSAGGGYCDCGDSEAWKQHVHCNLHAPTDQDSTSNDDILQRLPIDLCSRAKKLFRILLSFIVRLLCTEDYKSVPNALKNEFWDGEHKKYVTMLFNDEVHTYDQVINVLSRAVRCTKAEGHEFASLVDREGRTAIRIGSSDECREAQETIRLRTAELPLKCVIYPSSFISLQNFAQKLLTFLQDIISISDGFRRIFCESEMSPYEDEEWMLTEKFLLGEKMLWKSARSAVHQIFINSFFMDAEWKKIFASFYMKNYSTVWRNFVLDPDEYVSFTDLSVQIFTVPTLARYLISTHNAFQTIVDSFLEYCAPKLEHNKLVFSRTTQVPAQHEFRRAQSILYDLKYLLGVIPDSFTNELRENFLNGFRSFLRLLTYMHGMDKVSRQVGQHIEFDPEWETAFNLVIKIQSTLALILDWCASDEKLLISAYQITGEALAEIQRTTTISHLIKDQKNILPIVKTTVNEFKIDCFAYDVARDPVTVHIPVVRLFVALHVYLQRYSNTKTTFEQLCQDSKIYPCFVYEEALRIQVLCAQHVAGLWKRNGYSLSNQIYYYSNVKCRKEMFDRDILALQVGASLTPADTYMIQLLHKFNLLEWVRSPENGHSTEADSKIKEKVRIMEEFLHLLIMIIGERYEPGVGQVTREEKLTREVIHQLCISPMAHSELVRGLQESGQSELGSSDFEAVLKEVADFRRGTTTKGNYELKVNRLAEYNPFYYHYSKADQCKSEEYVIKRRKANDEPMHSTLLIPRPPPFTETFRPILNLFDSDIFLTLLKACLCRSVDTKAHLWSDAILSRALHLMMLGFYEQERSPTVQFHSRCEKFQFDQYFNQLKNDCSSRNLCRELVTFMINLYNRFNQSTDVPMDENTTSNAVQESLDSKKQAQRKRKDLAAQKRAKIIAQMAASQKNFLEQNKELCPDFLDPKSNTSEPNSASPNANDLMNLSMSPPTLNTYESMIVEPTVQSCLGTYDVESSPTVQQKLTCIFCQESSDVKLNSDALVLSAYVQNSRVLSRNRTRRIENWDSFDPTFMSSDLHWGVHVSSCGHAIHASCWTRYYNSIASHDQRRTLRMRSTANYDIERNEFLCPLCQTLSNTVIPVLPSLRSLSRDRKFAQMSFTEWLDGLEKALNGSIESRYEMETHEQQIFFNPCPLTSITKMMAERAAQNFQLLFGFAGDSRIQDFSDSIRERLLHFAKNVYKFGLNVDPNDESERIPIILWTSCAYTIQSIEQLLRVDSKSIFSTLSFPQSELMQTLTKVAAVYGLLHNSDELKKHCLKLLSVLLFSPSNIQNPSLADIDLFHLLVSLCFTLPILFASNETSSSLNNVPTGNLNDLYLMRLILMAHCVQILSSSGFLVDFSDEDRLRSVESKHKHHHHDRKVQIMEKLIEKIHKNSHSTSSKERLLPIEVIREKLRQSILPLLRSAALFYRHLTGVEWPVESELDEYSTISLYLGLPIDVADLFDIEHESNLSDLVNHWILTLSNNKSSIRYPTTINELHSLPHEYIDLMNKVSQGVAPYKYAKDEARSPCICLTCGEIVVRQSATSPPPTTTSGMIFQSILDQNVGPCNNHTQQCCGSIGLYLRVKECSLLLLNIIHDGRGNKARGALMPAPYLDEYGETDQNLRRGNPLHLCEERYRTLHRKWLSHGIPELISRNMELNHASIYTHNWSHF